MSTSEPSDDVLIWDYAHKQIDFGTQQFVTSIIGLGALFFAYGQVKNTFVDTIIAAIGLGASLVLWTNSYIAQRESYHALMVVETGRPGLIARLDEVRRWRGERPWRIFYQSAAVLIVYFNALMALAWITIILADAHAPLRYLYPADVSAVFVALFVAFWRRKQELFHAEVTKQMLTAGNPADHPPYTPQVLPRNPWRTGKNGRRLFTIVVALFVTLWAVFAFVVFPHVHIFGG